MPGRGVQRWNAKRDKNEPEVVEAFKAMGFSVVRISAKGAPDLLVGRQGRMWLVEVKMPTKGKTEAQEGFWMLWKGPVPRVVRSVEDVAVFARTEA